MSLSQALAANLPRSLSCLARHRPRTFLSDLVAGLTVGLVALPLAMAFAIASGVPPQAGIYCAIVAGFLVSALGGSTTQIAGPTGAFVVVVAGIVATHGMDGLFTCTLMAGLFLILLGVTGLGTAVKYIPRPVVIGFTNGIAVLIASTQIHDFLGLRIAHVPGEFPGRIDVLLAHAGTLSPQAALTGAAAPALIVLLRIFTRLPGYIVALVAGTTAAWGLGLNLEALADRLHASGRHLLLCGSREQPSLLMRKAEFHRHIGDENILPSLAVAVARARELLGRRAHEEPVRAVSP